jgi:ADP-dependent NAD(P)H-hydrate dehydratase / NAD(P)H-hydrate epimerase
MLTPRDVHILDQNAAYLGIPTSDLMENAGSAVAEFVKTTFPKAKKILVFCGPGNNGGDGFVAARLLTEHHKVTVIPLLTEKLSPLARATYEKLTRTTATIVKDPANLATLIKDADVLIDGLLGIGLSGELREPFTTVVKAINAARHPAVVSIDVPSGLGTSLAVAARATVTFHDIKQDMNPKNSGIIKTVDIGIPSDARTFVGPGDLNVYYPRPDPGSHKGQNGIVLVIGGGPYTGAPALSGLAALRTGCDLAFIATPKRAWQVVSSYSPNLIVHDLTSDMLVAEDFSVIANLLSRADAVIIGPGLGSHPKTTQAVGSILSELYTRNRPLVVDADAIASLRDNPPGSRHCPIIVTPHAGEFTKLTGEVLPGDVPGRIERVQTQAKRLGIVICLKGPTDIVSDGTSTRLNRVHNVAMSVGGTGDVLTGIIGALMSKGVSPFEAARAGLFLNGAAGNEVFAKKSYGLLATDLIEEIPSILRKYL